MKMTNERWEVLKKQNTELMIRSLSVIVFKKKKKNPRRHQITTQGPLVRQNLTAQAQKMGWEHFTKDK